MDDNDTFDPHQEQEKPHVPDWDDFDRIAEDMPYIEGILQHWDLLSSEGQDYLLQRLVKSKGTARQEGREVVDN